MLDWIAANLATILICALLIVIVFLIVRYLLRQKKAGKNSCGAGCAHCAMAGTRDNRARPPAAAGGLDTFHIGGIIMIETILKIDGMACGMCESHINDVVRRTCSVKKVTSSHTRGETVILSEQPVDERALRAAIKDTGYEVKEVSSAPYEKKGLFGVFKR